MRTDGDGRIIVVGGASRSGKSAYVRQRTKAENRIIAWDPEDQWAQEKGYRRITRRRELLEASQTAGHMRLAYVAGGDLAREFDFWAGVAMYAGRYVAPLVAIGEELADVTSPSKAPGSWGVLLRRGLKRGITIYAISQRWAEADKTAVGNASEFVLFRQSSGDDVRYLSRKVRVPEADIDGLLPALYPDGRLKIAPYIHKDARTGAIQRLELRF